jgi:NAD(P)-dependent dehydrogenase (short-subunit alcohol dehydrogenase family)
MYLATSHEGRRHPHPNPSTTTLLLQTHTTITSTMSDQKVVLILGAGSNIGESTSRAFAAKGYKVALASRSAKSDEDTADLKHFPIDLSKPSSVPELFIKVKEALGIPSVVIYNGNHNSLAPLFPLAHTFQKRPQPPSTTPTTPSLSPSRISNKTSLSTLSARMPPPNKPHLVSLSSLNPHRAPSFTRVTCSTRASFFHRY